MNRNHLGAAAIAALIGAAAWAGAPAGAQGTAPAPGCAGLAVTDPTGDATRAQGATDAPPNFDITGLFFKYEGGKVKATATFAGPGGDELPPGATGARWYIFFNKGTQEVFVRAGNITPDGVLFEYGHTEVDAAGRSTYVLDGETPGQFGDGFLEMTVPPALAKPGETITVPRVETSERIGNLLFPMDDTNTGKSYAVAKCEEPGAGQPVPDPAPGATPTPAPGGGGGGGTSGGGQPAPGTEARGLLVNAPKSAKAKGKKLSLKVTSNGEVKNIKATLKKGKKSVGKGSLARLNGKGTLKLKLSKKLKKGGYTLALTGINPDGRPASRELALKLK